MNAVVTSRHGEVRGSVADGVKTFKGIPYAAPPFGANRFRPPQPVEPWSGMRDALTFGPEAPQLRPDDPKIQALAPDPAVPGEDCLNLNIWSPDPGSSARLPVMVWIPGGMFEVGSGASYDGRHFARDGVVCVTINYRLGVDGFLYLGREPPTSACSTKSPPSNGCKRISPPSVAIPATSPSSVSRLVP